MTKQYTIPQHILYVSEHAYHAFAIGQQVLDIRKNHKIFEQFKKGDRVILRVKYHDPGISMKIKDIRLYASYDQMKMTEAHEQLNFYHVPFVQKIPLIVFELAL